jgi:hypothetical protein
MYDAAAKQLVWQGVASKAIDPRAKPDKRQKNIDKAAVKLLKNYRRRRRAEVPKGLRGRAPRKQSPGQELTSNRLPTPFGRGSLSG